ncbi:hypothetical protein SAMN03159340_02649 [Sphingomonas sp. NFR15]|nr:hypothetical protein SAMN03159340_02649 [Sphingomonas sp. NFR15]
MGRGEESPVELAPDQLAGASVLGGVVLGGAISLVIWAGIVSFFVF